MRKANIFYSVVMLSFTIALVPTSYALNPINSTQDGRIIQGGTYYNTAGNTTSFINSHAGGLWLKAGTTLRGLEVNSKSNLDNHGGTVHLYAPDNVVRVDGTIDVNALRNSQGAYLGNGGKVFIDAAYLFQNGYIFANGANGGLVQANVGAMTLGAEAQIQAKGSTGVGGTVAINSAGPVDLRRGALIDTSGKVLGTLDSNVINIEGGLVNNQGTLKADGVNSRGGSIRLVASGQSTYHEIKDRLQAATLNPPNDSSTPTITPQERIFLLQRTKGLIDNHEGQVFLAKDTNSSTPAFISNLNANGMGGNVDTHNDYSQNSAPRAGDGGNITVLALRGIQNLGNIRANGAAGRSGANPVNGGNGGTLSLLSQTSIVNAKGRLEANGGNGGASTGIATGGNGGNGGLMAFGYNGTMTNSGGMYADGARGGNGNHSGRGGNGGLLVFSGNNNPTGNGSLDVIGRPGGNNHLFLGGKSGTIVSPNPSTLGQGQVYFQQGYVNGQLMRTRATQQTQPVELLTHAENLIMLTKNGGSFNISENLFDRLLQARIQSVTDPTGALGRARSEVIFKNTPDSGYEYRNLLISSSRNYQTLDMTHHWHRDHDPGAFPELVLPSPLSYGQAFTGLNTLTISNNGSVVTSTMENQGPYAEILPTNFTNWLLGLNHTNLYGTRISLLANGNFRNTNVFGTTGTVSGGSVNIVAANTLQNGNFEQGILGTSLAGRFDQNINALHGGSLMLKAGQDINANVAPYGTQHSTIHTSGTLMGGVQRYISKRNFTSHFGYGFATGILSNGGLQGGIIDVKSERNILINNIIEANGTSPKIGRGGYIRLIAGQNAQVEGNLFVSGQQANGTIIIKP